jgi:cation:H+ antiporter
MVGTSVVFVAVCVFLEMNRYAGLGLLVVLALVWVVIGRGAARDYQAAQPAAIEWVLGLPSRLPMIMLFIAAGVVGLPLGARMVVESAIQIASHFSLSEAVVGLTILALSTSLPELATTLVAGFQGRADVAIGGILGSNVFNVLGIMGVAAVASPQAISVPPGFVALDLPVMLGTSLILTVFVLTGRPLGRVTGVVFTLGYVAYIAAVLLRS